MFQDIAFSVENSPAGSMQLLQKLQPMQVAMVVLEATGRYQRRVAADLLSHDIPVAVVNPRQARDFAKSLGKLRILLTHHALAARRLHIIDALAQTIKMKQLITAELK